MNCTCAVFAQQHNNKLYVENSLVLMWRWRIRKKVTNDKQKKTIKGNNDINSSGHQYTAKNTTAQSIILLSPRIFAQKYITY